MEGEQRTYIE